MGMEAAETTPGHLRLSLAVPASPSETVDLVIEELRTGLGRQGIRFEPGRSGSFKEGNRSVGKVIEWTPGRGFVVEWQPTPWDPGSPARIAMRVEPRDSGSTVSWEITDGASHLRGGEAGLTSWFANSVLPPVLRTLAPSGFGDWLIDRVARSPSGKLARESYAAPVDPLPNFALILDRLQLTNDDTLIEVGCGGGAFLRQALSSGCRATGVDHREEMARVASELNRAAVAEGRLQVIQAEAGSLPLQESSFTCAVMTSVFFFLDDPLRSLREMRRVLRPGGRLFIFTLGEESNGTPASPEPAASRTHFYQDAELAKLAKTAGFTDVGVERPDLEPFARKAGLSEEIVVRYRGPSFGQLLAGRK